MLQRSHETIILGGGVAGLACAMTLHRGGRSFLLLEATDRTGGRIASDVVDGFTLDRGFQVLLTAYPSCRELLDYESLNLCPFEPGAMVRQRGKFRKLSDPWRRPAAALATLTNPIGSIGDKLRIARLRYASSRGTLADLYQRPETTTLERLRADGFSERMIDQFFRPFLGGVFLDESLQTSSRMLEFVFRMFAAGDIAVPAAGMASIPQQMTRALPPGSIRTRSTVCKLFKTESGGFEVTLSDGELLTATNVVVALPSGAAARLLDAPETITSWHGTTNLYFATDASPNNASPANRSPANHRMLMLRGDEPGPVQSAVVMSDVAPSLAPAGHRLVSVSVDSSDDPSDGPDDMGLEARVREQLTDWFGQSVRTWRHLRTYRIPYALPGNDLGSVIRSSVVDVQRWGPRLLIAGDHRQTPSIEGAMDSGIRAADSIEITA